MLQRCLPRACVALLMREARVCLDARDGFGSTPLHAAVLMGEREIVEDLLIAAPPRLGGLLHISPVRVLVWVAVEVGHGASGAEDGEWDVLTPASRCGREAGLQTEPEGSWPA